jgi:hypothetical protein
MVAKEDQIARQVSILSTYLDFRFLFNASNRGGEGDPIAWEA